MRPRLKPLAALMVLALQGCSMAPTYTVPSIDLPAHYREIILLRDMEGYSIEELAQQLGINRQAAKSRLHRARLLAHPPVARAVDEARPYRSYFPLGAPDRD